MGDATRHELPVYIGRDAIASLLDYGRDNSLERFVLVSDRNTFGALGRRVEQALRAAGCDVITVVLDGDVIADEASIVQILVHVDARDRTYLAVGSGTVTDLARFVSHRTRSAFISLPTAPSVDGFTSIGAPLVVRGLKQTFVCQAPAALFADIETLRQSPRAMIAAGFGDMVGKLLSIADWKLGHVVWDGRYDEGIARRFVAAADACVEMRREIGGRTEDGIHALMNGLVQSGLAMLDYGDSSPASGAEHHASHFWEMKLLREGRRPILHGAKVGVASILTARRYRALLEVGPARLERELQWSRVPSRDRQVASIRAAYGSLAERIIREQAAFLDLGAEQFQALRRRIIDRWDEVQAIARALPAPEQLTQWLEAVGAPTSGAALGLTDEEVSLGLACGPYLRNRFTIGKLWLMLGFESCAS